MLTVAQDGYSSNTRRKGVTEQWAVRQSFSPSRKPVAQELRENDLPEEVIVVILPDCKIHGILPMINKREPHRDKILTISLGEAYINK